MKLIKKHFNYIKHLASKDSDIRNSIIKLADKEVICAVCECQFIKNVLTLVLSSLCFNSNKTDNFSLSISTFSTSFQIESSFVFAIVNASLQCNFVNFFLSSCESSFLFKLFIEPFGELVFVFNDRPLPLNRGDGGGGAY